MPVTINSSQSAYATVGDLTARYDVRVLQQLASDNDTPLSVGSLSSSSRILTAMMTASGMVKAACTVGLMYEPQDLNDLVNNPSNTASLQFLKQLVCDLAMGILFEGRPDRDADPPKSYDRALERLERIRLGAAVFGITQNQNAGMIGETTDTAVVVEQRGGVVVEADRFFSRRNNRLHG